MEYIMLGSKNNCRMYRNSLKRLIKKCLKNWKYQQKLYARNQTQELR